MSPRTRTFRQLGRGFSIFHCTQIIGEWPLLIRVQMPTPMPFFLRTFQTTSRTSDRSFTNLLADADNPPPVQVSSISDKEGIRLADGLVLSAASIFLEGQVYLWDVPSPKTGEGDRTEKDQWKGWTEDHFELFDVVVPKPEILLLGTGKRIVQPPPFMRTYLPQKLRHPIRCYGYQKRVRDVQPPRGRRPTCCSGFITQRST